MNENTFNDLMNQDEHKKEDSDQTGLFNVLKNIQKRKCSCDFLCIEIGRIEGPFDALKPKKVSIMTNRKENVQLIIKPVIIVNNTNTLIPSPILPNNTIPNINLTNLFENEECDVLATGGSSNSMNFNKNNEYNGNYNQRFKQSDELDDDNNQMKKTHFEIKRKFYRKVEYANDILANDIFKQGLNIILLKREKGYPKTYERTFNTNIDPIESDALSCTIRDAGYDKIIVITGIGKWMGSVTPRLIKEIKQIGGPDLNSLISVDSEDNSVIDHSFILIGRRGLCRYNGIFRVKNYDVTKDLKRFFPDLTSDPNDCYFENVTFENEKNKAASIYINDNSNKNTKNNFYHLVDLRLTLNLANDNRFSYKAPIITSVSPNRGPVKGNQKIQIFGYNFGKSILDIKEILVRGVICKNIEFNSENILSCITGNSFIMGAGPGNIVIKLLCGLTSPLNTCSVYEYNSKIPDIPIQDDNINNNDMINSVDINNPPSAILVPQIIPQIIPVRNVIRSIHNFRPRTILPSFSFKEKNKENNYSNSNKNLQDYDDVVLDDLKEKIQKFDFKKNRYNPNKIDNLVTENFKNVMSLADNNGFGTFKDGLRKKRFSNLMKQLK